MRPGASSLDTELTALLVTAVVVVDVVSVTNGNELAVGKVSNRIDAGSTMDAVGPPITGVGSAGAGFGYPIGIATLLHPGHAPRGNATAGPSDG